MQPWTENETLPSSVWPLALSFPEGFWPQTFPEERKNVLPNLNGLNKEMKKQAVEEIPARQARL